MHNAQCKNHEAQWSSIIFCIVHFALCTVHCFIALLEKYKKTKIIMSKYYFPAR